MPLYEYECGKGHRYEYLYPISHIPEQVVCLECSNNRPFNIANETIYAERIFSLPANIQRGKPTIAFINPQTGQARIATSEHEATPRGFIKEELKGPMERSRFENQQNAIAHQEDEIYNETIKQKRDEFKKNHIDLIKQNISKDAAESDNPAATTQLMNAAIKRIRNKPSLKKKRKTEFRLDVNHIDKSNL